MRRMRIQNADKMVGVSARSSGGLEPGNPHWAAQGDLDSRDPHLPTNAPWSSGFHGLGLSILRLPKGQNRRRWPPDQLGLCVKVCACR